MRSTSPWLGPLLGLALVACNKDPGAHKKRSASDDDESTETATSKPRKDKRKTSATASATAPPSVPQAPPPSSSEPLDPATSKALSDLTSIAHCADGQPKVEPWCTLAAGFASAPKATLVPGKWLGLYSQIGPNGDGTTFLVNQAVSLMQVNPAGDKVSFSPLRSSVEIDASADARLKRELPNLLVAGGGPIGLDAKEHDYLEKQFDRFYGQRYVDVVPHGQGYRFELEKARGELRKVGNMWARILVFPGPNASVSVQAYGTVAYAKR